MYYTFIYYISVALTIALTTIGVALGQSIVAQGTIEALNIQPYAKNSIVRMSLLGTAFIETSAVLALVIAMLLLFSKKPEFITNFASNVPSLGIAIAIGISGLIVGLATSFPVKAACLSAARQPFMSGKILNFMLLSISFIQTPIIFSFIFALFIWYQTSVTLDIYDAVRLLSVGIAMGLGGAGPAIGLSLFSKKSCFAAGYNKKAFNTLTTFSFISQAIIETPVIFAMVTALILISTKAYGNPLKAIAFVMAAIAVGIGNFGPAIGSAYSAGGAALQIVENPSASSSVSRISMISQGVIDSCVIYCWLISLLIILFT